MQAQRLTNDLRERITAAAIAHRFDDAEKQLCDAYTAWGQSFAMGVLGPDVARMRKLPAAWFKFEERHYAEVDGLRSPFWLDTDYDTGRLTISLRPRYRSCDFPIILPVKTPIPYILRGNWRIEKDSDAYAELEALCSKAEKLNDERASASQKISAILGKFSTVPKLIAGWPEIKPFIPAAAAPALVPALPVAELNKLLGL